MRADSPERPYLAAEVLHSVEREFAVTLADVLIRRIPIAFEERDHGAAAAAHIARVLAPHFGWSSAGVDERAARLRTSRSASFRHRVMPFGDPRRRKIARDTIWMEHDAGIGASNEQRWSDLPCLAAVAGLSTHQLLGSPSACVIAAQDDAVRASAIGSIAILTYALCTLLCAGHAYLAFRQRESWWMRGGMLLLCPDLRRITLRRRRLTWRSGWDAALPRASHPLRPNTYASSADVTGSPVIPA